jgi:hypothetical protein
MHHRYVIVLDRLDEDDHVKEGRPAESDQEGMEQVAAELQEAMNFTGQPTGFFRVAARYEIKNDHRLAHVMELDELIAHVRNNT